MSKWVIADVREVDDAGSTHLESVMTAGFIVQAVEDGHITFENNIRPDWQAAGKELPKTKRKIARWSQEILDGNAALGNLSIRLDPTTPHELVQQESGQLDLEIEHGSGKATDTSVDSQSRLAALVRAAKASPVLFNPDQRIAVRVYIADLDKAHEVAAAYNTRGDKVNDSAAKFAHAAQPLEKVAGWLVKDSGNPHLSSDNIEVLSNTVSASSTKLAGFNTLVKALEQEWDTPPVNSTQVERMGEYISACWNKLVAVRPEFGLTTVRDRRHYRDTSVAGTALALYGVMAVIDAGYQKGLSADELEPHLKKLGPDDAGEDWLSKTNGTWQSVGVLASSTLKDGSEVLRPRNTFQSRMAIAAKFKERAGL
jgi:DNA-sulfur modification-associated